MDKDSKKQMDMEQLIKIDLAKEKTEKIKIGWLQRKKRKLKKIFADFWLLGKTGFIMGGIVGCCMGFIGGCVSAYQTKSLLPIPVAMCASGFFFASLMSLGACLRVEHIIVDENNICYAYISVVKSEGKYNFCKNTKIIQTKRR